MNQEKLLETLNRLSNAYKYFDSEAFESLDDPHIVSKKRIALASIVGQIGEHLADARLAWAEAKVVRKKKYSEFRKLGKSIEDSKALALAESSEAQDEYWYNRLRFAHDDGVEHLNALASYIKTLELQAKNMT